MVKLIKDYLGDRILAQPLESHPLKPGTPLPSPELLKGKFLIKNKKRDFKKSAKQHGGAIAGEEKLIEPDSAVAEGSPVANKDLKETEAPTEASTSAVDVDEDPDEEDPELRRLRETAVQMSSTAAAATASSASTKEPETVSEISAMVNYMEPASFYSFEYAAKKNVAYECCSISENSATNLLKEAPEDFVNFNKRQLSRIYPKGTRVDSGNYMPQLFWNSGCQLVALNFQTLDLGLQLNLGMFHYQRRCGYLLKPEFMRRPDRRFDPFAETTVDGIVASSVSVEILSGYFLSDRKIGTYVEVEMYGLPADTVRKRFRTRVVPSNGINPSYNQEAFVFKKVVLPQLATLRIAALEESGRLIGQRFLPVDSLRPGYRHVTLFTELMQPLPLATLFVCLKVSDYVSDVFAEFAAALANPIQYLNEMEKHQQQLMVLTEDFEVTNKPHQPQPQQHLDSESQQGNLTASNAEATGSVTPRRQQQPRKLQRTATLGGPEGAPPSPPLVEASGGSAVATSSAADLTAAATGGGVTRAAGGGDSTCVHKPSLEDIKKDKKYQKLVQKCEKEYLALLKRNQKELVSLRAKHRIALAKLHSDGVPASSLSSSTKRRFFGGGGKLLSQSLRQHAASHEEIRGEAARSASEKEFGKRAGPLSSAQDSEVRDQLEIQARAEYELQVRHRAAQQDELLRAVVTATAVGEKTLNSLYTQEHAALKKAQEKHRNAEARQLTKQFKAQQQGASANATADLREARRECQQRQVAGAVAELQALDGLHKKRLRELRDHGDCLRRAVETEFDEERRKLDEEQLSRLVEINKSAVETTAGAAAAGVLRPSN